MKKTILIPICALLVTTACKKDRTCSCTTTYNVNQNANYGGTNYKVNVTQTSTETVEVKKTTKKNALATDCASAEGTINGNATATDTYSNFPSQNYTYTEDGTVKRTCTLD